MAFGLLNAAIVFETKGYGHCDIKPDNVMMIGLEPVLVDFGAVTPLGQRVLESTAAYGLDANTLEVTTEYDLNCIVVTLVRCFMPSFVLNQSTRDGLTKFIEASITAENELTTYGSVCLNLLQVSAASQGLQCLNPKESQ